MTDALAALDRSIAGLAEGRERFHAFRRQVATALGKLDGAIGALDAEIRELDESILGACSRPARRGGVALWW